MLANFTKHSYKISVYRFFHFLHFWIFTNFIFFTMIDNGQVFDNWLTSLLKSTRRRIIDYAVTLSSA